MAATLATEAQASLLLLLPPICVILGWTYLINDEKVSAIGRYVRLRLAPELSRLCDCDTQTMIFGWEAFHRSDNDRILRKLLQLAADLGAFCLPAVAAIVVYSFNGPWTPPFVTVSVAELVIVTGLGIQIVRFADLSSSD